MITTKHGKIKYNNIKQTQSYTSQKREPIKRKSVPRACTRVTDTLILKLRHSLQSVNEKQYYTLRGPGACSMLVAPVLLS